MRSLWNLLSDPTLHLLTIALVLVYLTLSGGSQWRDSYGASPLPTCKLCRAHFLPEKPCECQIPKKLAKAVP